MRKILNTKIAGILAALIFTASPLFAGWGYITEIAFDESAPNTKWIEIFVPKDTNPKGAKLFHAYNTSPQSAPNFRDAFTFPDVELAAGTHIVLEFNIKHTDPHITDSSPVVFYSTFPDTGDRRPFSGQGALYLTSTDTTTWVDAVIFFRGDTDNFCMQHEYSSATAHGFWSPPADPSWTRDDYQKHLPGPPKALPGFSIQRKRDSVTGLPLTAGNVGDWFLGPLSRGTGYFATPPTIDDSKLIVYPNPFYPEKGESARIVLPAGFKKSTRRLRIYAADGVLVFEKDVAMDMLDWDGRNKSGKICASGQYFYYIEMEDASGESGKMTLIR
ncbi:MAG: hypothetical protein GX817_00285 [Elusimicrobia bacterium]|nr:hypothetical protein [Elusimicrobiota bacterium]